METRLGNKFTIIMIKRKPTKVGKRLNIGFIWRALLDKKIYILVRTAIMNIKWGNGGTGCEGEDSAAVFYPSYSIFK